MSACPECAAHVARTHRFCSQCGARTLAEAATTLDLAPEPRADRKLTARRSHRSGPLKMQPERKQVSVMFVDLCDSTAHVLNSDPEEARAYLDEALLIMTEAVETYGGTVSQLLGDGLLALFGAPVAQEDHALRACLAALGMQASVRKRCTADGIPPFVLRIGIHSGEVIVGVTGQSFWSHYRADGTTIHLASRLEKLAAPGSVLVSASTYRLIADQLDATSLGAQTIRGVDTPMELFELSLGSEGSAAAPLTRRQRWAPLVGRDETLNVLEALALAARGGAMRVVGLRGEAGIGKSRLIAEWCSNTTSKGFALCTTYARGYSSGSAYSVIADLVRGLVGLGVEPDSHPESALTQLKSWPVEGSRHLAALRDLMGVQLVDEDWNSLTPTQRRRRISEALHWLITQRLRSGPLLLVLEDIFLADRESQRLLESLVPRLEGMPLLVCVSYRQDFEHRWADAAWFVEHWIPPLREADMCALARALLGAHDSVGSVVNELVERADGNPFFLEQLVITLIDEGSLVGTPGAYRLTRPQAELRAPASIAAVITARIDRLPAAAKAALEAAAVLGDPITAGLVAAMQGTDASQADQLLRLGVASGLLVSPRMAGTDGPACGFTFRHALVQEVVAGTLTRPRRKVLHRCAFVALKAHLVAGDTDAVSTLTHHAFRGEEWEQAATYAVKSMARAVSRSANREALRLFELGLDASRRVVDEPTALSLELGLLLEGIGALMALGHIDAIFANLERAEAIAGKLDDQRRRATVSLQTAVFLWMRGRYTHGLVSATQALDAGRMAERRNLQMAASQARMMMFHGLGRYRESVSEACRVLNDFAPELDGHRLMAGWATTPIINLRSFYASALWRLGDYRAAQQALDSAYDVLAGFDHPYSHGLVDFVQAQMWIELGRYVDAERLMRISVKSCVIHDVPTLSPCSVSMLGGTLTRSGHAEEAAALLECAIRDRIYLAGGSYGEMFIRLNLGVALRHTGQWQQAIESGQQAVELATAGEQFGHRAEALFELAETLRGAGQAARALECFRQSLDQARRSEMPFYVECASRHIDQLQAESAQ